MLGIVNGLGASLGIDGLVTLFEAFDRCKKCIQTGCNIHSEEIILEVGGQVKHRSERVDPDPSSRPQTAVEA